MANEASLQSGFVAGNDFWSRKLQLDLQRAIRENHHVDRLIGSRVDRS
jgi:hypothetical protein